MSSLNGEIILADQSNGKPLQLRVFGDEFYSRRETLDGHTVVYDKEKGCYCFVTLAAGRFISTGIPICKPVPLGLRKHIKELPEVRNEEFGRQYSSIRPTENDSDTNLIRTLGPDGGLLSGRKLHQGQVKGLTVIVDFDDVQTRIAKSDVEAMLNSNNYTDNGNFSSVKTYFETISTGKLEYTNMVVGPIRLSKRRSHYINNLFVREAMDIVVNDLNIDLSQFDSRNDGIVDAINFLYAGNSQYNGKLWPHNSVQNLRYGNFRTHYYQLTGLGMHKVDLRIGTICHENGHLLCRFPDMYDYGRRDGDFEKSQGIGRYCLMGSGNHLNSRRTPAPICGYLRQLAGWVETVVDLNVAGNYIADHGKYDTVFKYSTEKANEYFIVENRSQLGLDSHLPSSGLAVLHCDTLGSNEWQDGTRNKHYQCALIQADGHLDLENNRNTGDSGDLFKEKSGEVLSHMTVPSSREWDDTDSGLLIRNVTAPGNQINFAVGAPLPTADLNDVKAETFPNEIIPDNDEAGISSTLEFTEDGKIKAVEVEVNIIHSWISDLTVSLKSPSGTEVVLHKNEGHDSDDINRTWKSSNFNALTTVHDENVMGEWVLHIVDKASQDVGRLEHWGLNITIEPEKEKVVEVSAQPNQAIPDSNASGISSTLAVNQAGNVKVIIASVDITHTYRGDLQVELVAPSGRSALLHDKEGSWQHDIKRTYEIESTPALANLIGESLSGDWQLRVRDLAQQDTGTLNTWSLNIWY